ncbi:hypothetical protein AVEN_52625-1 [Araneus ventricosus]|uniref:Uncharacterized protein n=1 Tax=Araneus ventricosus TaxID=182803 RepID=A0A4Y2ESE7_ARAVE|nr:hypothetical protein AVEN_52625-1 [Araneus ventricosus]
MARRPEFQEPNLHEELVKVNLKPEVKTYVSAVRNICSAVKGVKSDSKLVINGAREISSLKSVGKLPRRKAIFLLRLSPDTTVYEPSTQYDSNVAVEFNGVGDFVVTDTIAYDDVVMAVKELKYTSTIGIDNIPSFIIKGCAEFLVYLLLALFNLSLKTNTFPHAWKLTKIVPVFIKGNAE